MKYSWTEQNKLTWQKLTSVIDKRVTSVYVNFYAFQAEKQLDDTPLQLNFTDGTIIFLDGESDGESLRVAMDAWHDPFSDKNNLENTLYIQQFGHWIQVNVSDELPFEQIVRKAITRIHPIINQFGRLNGVQFEIGDIALNFVVDFDECHIVWGNSNLSDMYTVINELN